MSPLPFFHCMAIYPINKYVRERGLLHSVRERLSAEVKLLLLLLRAYCNYLNFFRRSRHRHHQHRCCCWCCIFHSILVHCTAGQTLYSFTRVHIAHCTHNSKYIDMVYFFFSVLPFLFDFFAPRLKWKKVYNRLQAYLSLSLRLTTISTCWYTTQIRTHACWMQERVRQISRKKTIWKTHTHTFQFHCRSFYV